MRSPKLSTVWRIHIHSTEMAINIIVSLKHILLDDQNTTYLRNIVVIGFF